MRVLRRIARDLDAGRGLFAGKSCIEFARAGLEKLVIKNVLRTAGFERLGFFLLLGNNAGR